MWFDSHCHITADAFAEDRGEVLDQAAQAGVEGFVAIGSGYGISHNRLAVELAARDPRVWASVGVHPHDAAELDDAGRGELNTLLDAPRVVAVGESGLDYHYMNSPREAQRSVLAEQIALARELDLPVSIHVRGDDESAYDELLEIWLTEGGDTLEGVLHCYTGSLAFALRAIEHGFYVSFSGIGTFTRSDALRDVARGLPLERLMIETDAPFLAPEGHRGRRNEPAWVPVVGQTLAQLHDVSVEQVATATARNARALYRLPETS